MTCPAKAYFDQLERRLADLVGTHAMQQLRGTLEIIVTNHVIDEPLRQIPGTGATGRRT